LSFKGGFLGERGADYRQDFTRVFCFFSLTADVFGVGFFKNDGVEVSSFLQKIGFYFLKNLCLFCQNWKDGFQLCELKF
jgi:hypothetical protein